MENLKKKYPEPVWEHETGTPGDYYDRKAHAFRVWGERYVKAKGENAPEEELDYLRLRLESSAFVGD